MFPQTDLCGKLFDFLRKYKDLSVSSSCLSEFLFRAPSRRLQADYYEVVTNPIDLLRIQVIARAIIMNVCLDDEKEPLV